MSHASDEPGAPGPAGWAHHGQARPAFAREPGPGEESVWDYPRPPVVRPDARAVVVQLGSHVVARSAATYRLCETASPPTFYIPKTAIDSSVLVPSRSASWCEWKGRASYWHVVIGDTRITDAACGYPKAAGAYACLADTLAFYPSRLACFVAGQRVLAQDGGFYGGWVTSEIVGPYKGEPGTSGW